MYNSNGPPRGFNVSQDQSSYDLVFKDIIINSNLGTLNSTTGAFSYTLGTDSINQIYKAELITASIKFNTTINNNVKNQTLIVSIPQLNGGTVRVAGNVLQGNNSQGNNSTQGSIFCQIPDNVTPLGIIGTTIGLFVGPHMYDSIQFYNPPINKINIIDVLFFDTLGNQITVDSNSGTINTFYLTLRIHYFQKRYNTTSFSTSVFNNVGSGTLDSMFSINR